MFRSRRRKRDFWSGDASQGEVEVGPVPAVEDIQPGSGNGWKLMWEHAAEPNSYNDDLWSGFLDGDTAERREVAWLLSKG